MIFLNDLVKLIEMDSLVLDTLIVMQLMCMILELDDDLEVLDMLSEDVETSRVPFNAELEFQRNFNFKELTRFNFEEIVQMANLFGFPEYIILENRSKIRKLDGFVIFLARLVDCHRRFTDQSRSFGINKTKICLTIKWFLEFLSQNWFHLLKVDSAPFLDQER